MKGVKKMINKTETLCYDMKTLKSVIPLGANKLYELVHSDGFPKITVGKRILVPKIALEKWLSDNAFQAKGE